MGLRGHYYLGATLNYGLANVAHTAASARPVLVLGTQSTGLCRAVDKIIELAMMLVQVDAATCKPLGPMETFEGFDDRDMLTRSGETGHRHQRYMVHAHSA